MKKAVIFLVVLGFVSPVIAEQLFFEDFRDGRIDMWASNLQGNGNALMHAVNSARGIGSYFGITGANLYEGWTSTSVSLNCGLPGGSLPTMDGSDYNWNSGDITWGIRYGSYVVFSRVTMFSDIASPEWNGLSIFNNIHFKNTDPNTSGAQPYTQVQSRTMWDRSQGYAYIDQSGPGVSSPSLEVSADIFFTTPGTQANLDDEYKKVTLIRAQPNGKVNIETSGSYASYDFDTEGMETVLMDDIWRMDIGIDSNGTGSLGDYYLSSYATSFSTAQVGFLEAELGRTHISDFNLDYCTDGNDFQIWNANKFQTGKVMITGDSNNDGTCDGSDFQHWNVAKFSYHDDMAHDDPIAFVFEYNYITGTMIVDFGANEVNSWLITGPQAISIDKFGGIETYNGTMSAWTQQYFQGKEQWIATFGAAEGGPHQIATYATGLTKADFPGYVPFTLLSGGPIGYSEVVVVPEPATMAMLAMGCLGMIIRRRQ